MSAEFHLESNSEKPLTAKEAAEFFRVNPRTVKRAAMRGDLPGHFILGRWYFYLSELQEAVRAAKPLLAGAEVASPENKPVDTRQLVPLPSTRTTCRRDRGKNVPAAS